MNRVLDQLARTGLLPTDLAGEILAGKVPPTSEVTLHLVIAAMDAHSLTDNDPKSSWTERRISRQNLGLMGKTVSRRSGKESAAASPQADL